MEKNYQLEKANFDKKTIFLFLLFSAFHHPLFAFDIKKMPISYQECNRRNDGTIDPLKKQYVEIDAEVVFDSDTETLGDYDFYIQRCLSSLCRGKFIGTEISKSFPQCGNTCGLNEEPGLMFHGFFNIVANGKKEIQTTIYVTKEHYGQDKDHPDGKPHELQFRLRMLSKKKKEDVTNPGAGKFTDPMIVSMNDFNDCEKEREKEERSSYYIIIIVCVVVVVVVVGVVGVVARLIPRLKGQSRDPVKTDDEDANLESAIV